MGHAAAVGEEEEKKKKKTTTRRREDNPVVVRRLVVFINLTMDSKKNLDAITSNVIIYSILVDAQNKNEHAH